MIPYAGKPRAKKPNLIGNTNRRFARAPVQIPAEAKELREERMRLKLTQAYIAAKIGTSTKSLSNWETGNFKPSKTSLKRWRDAVYEPQAED